MGELAAKLSGGRVRAEARIHVSSSCTRFARGLTIRIAGINCWLRRARAMRSQTRTGIGLTFDHLLVREAQELGVEYFGRVTLATVSDATVTYSGRTSTRAGVCSSGEVRRRCHRASRVSAPCVCSSVKPIAELSGHAGPIFAFLRSAATCGDAIQQGPGGSALSHRRCGGASRFRRWMGLGAAVQQRHDQRGGRGDRYVRVTVTIRARVRRRGIGCWIGFPRSRNNSPGCES